ncbi:MAG TPA: hypothetical protein RMH99_19185 [Sandaracinaceae bacterium LLY-WYZ-13_1]|nr:hypothetical protein [Sandaracinaceae bacterium LLY-WYZ-13_1]
MQTRFVLYALVATAMVGGFAFVADALVTSDEEHLTAIAEQLTEAERGERVEGVLRWMDLSREPVRLEHGERVRRFREDDDHRLAEGVHDALAGFDAEDLEVVQRSVRVDGERGTVAIRARARGELHDVTLHVVRSGQGWLIERVQAS